MDKIQLIDAIATEAAISKVDAKRALDALVKVACSTLMEGSKVPISGLGTFVPTKKASRMGRNPRTGAQIKIPAKNSVKFRIAADLSAKIK